MKFARKTSGENLSITTESRRADQSKPTDWITDRSFECYGIRLRIRCNQEFSRADWQMILPPFAQAVETGVPERVFSLLINKPESVLYEDDAEKMRFPGADWVMDALRGQLKVFISQNSACKVFIHAGVIAWQNKLILLPGDGFAGKTTLTAEFVKAGAIYYSDDLAVVDRNGLVYPYPKPLSMRQRGATNGAQVELDITDFKGVQGALPLPVRLVVITEYERGAHWRPQVLSPGQGALEILKHTTNSLKEPQFAVDVLQKIAVHAKIIKSKRGEARRAVRAILREC